MRINSTNGVAFKATLKGDIEKIKQLALAGGASKRAVHKATYYMQNLIPDDKNKIYTYLKKYVNEDKTKESIIKTGIKLVKDDVVIEKNIDIREINQKNILNKYISEIKKLLNGKTKPDTYLTTYSIPKGSWLDKFNDTETTLTAFTPLF